MKQKNVLRKYSGTVNMDVSFNDVVAYSPKEAENKIRVATILRGVDAEVTSTTSNIKEGKEIKVRVLTDKEKKRIEKVVLKALKDHLSYPNFDQLEEAAEDAVDNLSFITGRYEDEKDEDEEFSVSVSSVKDKVCASAVKQLKELIKKIK